MSIQDAVSRNIIDADPSTEDGQVILKLLEDCGNEKENVKIPVVSGMC